MRLSGWKDGGWMYSQPRPGAKVELPVGADPGAARRRFMAVAMFAVWFGVVSFLAWRHLLWRDEVRALSFALEGDSVFAMLKDLHGESHPAVWYLLLRGAHALIPRPEVLLLVAIFVAAAAVLILLLRAPFSLPFLALLLMGRFTIYEYSVMARNYGISMLALFLFAVCYERHRDRGCLLGVLLFLLANCNPHSVLLAGGLLVFWFVDILGGDAAGRPRKIRIFLYNAALAALGVAICFVTVFQTRHKMELFLEPGGVTFGMLCQGLFLPATQFMDICLPGWDKLATAMPLLGNQTVLLIPQVLWSLILFGGTLGLIRRTGAFLAALTTLVGLSLFFVVFHPGGYRHQALWLVFMICLYWLAASGNARQEPVSPVRRKRLIGPLSTLGVALFVLLLLVQLPGSAYKIIGIVSNRDYGVSSILAGNAGLKQAVVIADPDYLVETLPYYVSNPTYLLRDQRFGNLARYTHQARLELSLGDVLADARRLRQQTGGPVVILLAIKLDPSLPARVYQDKCRPLWKLAITPEQARAFQSSTHLLGHYAPLQNDEHYDAYVMDD